jgi:GTP cyclohydrolase II
MSALSTSDVTPLEPGALTVYARARLPTRQGEFEIVAFARGGRPIDHVAVIRGDLAGAERVPVRIHSECLTGDVLGSLKCDCRDQLEMALGALGQRPAGALLYLNQEGRGIGLANKIRAYALQDKGMDTVEANRHLGFDDDLRDYSDAAEMLRRLGVRSVVLLTNNPDKIDGLEPISAEPNVHNEGYLRVKRRKMGHL